MEEIINYLLENKISFEVSFRNPMIDAYLTIQDCGEIIQEEDIYSYGYFGVTIEYGQDEIAQLLDRLRNIVEFG